MEKLSRIEIEKAVKELHRKLREIQNTVNRGKRTPLYRLFEDLQMTAHDARQLVAEGGLWTDHHSTNEH